LANQCLNKLSITGDYRHVTKFLNIYIPRFLSYNMDTSFAKLLPKHGDLCFGTDDPYGMDWVRKHMNDPLQVKNGIYPKKKNESDYRFWEERLGVEVIREKNYTELHFSTAWSEPRDWVGMVALKFPELSFDLSYYEPGAAFAGRLSVESDKVHVIEHVVSGGIEPKKGTIAHSEFQDYLIHLDFNFE